MVASRKVKKGVGKLYIKNKSHNDIKPNILTINCQEDVPMTLFNSNIPLK